MPEKVGRAIWRQYCSKGVKEAMRILKNDDNNENKVEKRTKEDMEDNDNENKQLENSK